MRALNSSPILGRSFLRGNRQVANCSPNCLFFLHCFEVHDLHPLLNRQPYSPGPDSAKCFGIFTREEAANFIFKQAPTLISHALRADPMAYTTLLDLEEIE